jgi:hypothetical protein
MRVRSAKGERMEFRLIIGRMSFLADETFITEMWGIDPGQRRLRPSDFSVKWADPLDEFGLLICPACNQRIAAAVLIASGADRREAIAHSGNFARKVIEFLPSPWGLKSKHVRAWLVNPLLPFDTSL